MGFPQRIFPKSTILPEFPKMQSRKTNFSLSLTQENGGPITEIEWKAKFDKTLLKIKKEDDRLILNINEEYLIKQ